MVKDRSISMFDFHFFAGLVLSEPPEYGSEHCKNVLATDCSGYSYEPVCSYDGERHVTYNTRYPIFYVL